jgi:hypothetical protein
VKQGQLSFLCALIAGVVFPLPLQAATEPNPFGVPPLEPGQIHTFSLVMFVVMLVFFSLWSWKKGEIRPGLLVLIAAMSASWQEFYADWGAYLYWNPGFPQLPWGDTAFTTPVKPLFIPFSWGWYFAFILPLLLAILNWLHGKFPGFPRFLLVLITAGPLFYGYNIFQEKNAGDMAWWGYLETFGPSAQAAYSQYPLVWPAVSLVLWTVVLLWLLMLKDNAGFWRHERWLGVDKVAGGARQAVARVVAFALLFNISCLVLVTIPSILGRVLFGVDHPLIP